MISFKAFFSGATPNTFFGTITHINKRIALIVGSVILAIFLFKKILYVCRLMMVSCRIGKAASSIVKSPKEQMTINVRVLQNCMGRLIQDLTKKESSLIRCFDNNQDRLMKELHNELAKIVANNQKETRICRFIPDNTKQYLQASITQTVDLINHNNTIILITTKGNIDPNIQPTSLISLLELTNSVFCVHAIVEINNRVLLKKLAKQRKILKMLSN